MYVGPQNTLYQQNQKQIIHPVCTALNKLNGSKIDQSTKSRRQSTPSARICGCDKKKTQRADFRNGMQKNGDRKKKRLKIFQRIYKCKKRGLFYGPFDLKYVLRLLFLLSRNVKIERYCLVILCSKSWLRHLDLQVFEPARAGLKTIKTRLSILDF